MTKKRIRNKLPPFVPLTWEMLNSAAYKELRPSAAKMLPYFIGKVHEPWSDPARYETPFSLPYSEARRLGFGKTTFFKGIKALVAHGFVDPISKGGLRSFGLTKNIFKLSKRWKYYGTAAFIEKRWETFLSKRNQDVAKVKDGGWIDFPVKKTQEGSEKNEGLMPILSRSCLSSIISHSDTE